MYPVAAGLKQRRREETAIVPRNSLRAIGIIIEEEHAMKNGMVIALIGCLSGIAAADEVKRMKG